MPDQPQTTVTEAMIQAGTEAFEELTAGNVWPAYETMVEVIYRAMESARAEQN